MKEQNEDTSTMRVEIRMKQAKKNILDFLIKSRRILTSGLSVENYSSALEAEQDRQAQLQCVDYALVQLYLMESKYGELKALLKGDNACNLVDVAEVLKNNARYLAVLYFSKEKFGDALETLRKLGSGELRDKTDDSAKGVSETIELLCEIDDPDLVFKYAPWVFEADDLSAIKIFTSKLRKVELPTSSVLNFLGDYPPDLEREYLEYLIASTNNKEERFHTKLALNYIDAIIRLKPNAYLPFGVRVEPGNESGILGEIRAKLIDMLENGVHHNAHAVSHVISKTNLYEETLIIYKKLQEHERALKLLIWKIEDLEWAERYCMDCFNEELSTKGLEDLNPLFIILLRICLHPEEPHARNEEFALSTLTKHAHNIDPVQALALLSDGLSVECVNEYIRRIVQSSKNKLRQSLIVYNMCNIQYTQNKAIYGKGLSRRVVVTNNTICPVCDKSIDASSVFVVAPDLTLVHFKCGNKEKMHVHPVNGTNFAQFPVNFDDQITDDKVLSPPSYSL
ncbi:hypothetical protein AKO1_011514 [Acrasis kona]|uniref:Vacuolar sorting protein 39/Transforming growth factor beta receptor-associated domain-containing protein n=1 Tax=Acrasis kona TaxID=1008807 RepID=A0AAW2Z1U3_9EUKA